MKTKTYALINLLPKDRNSGTRAVAYAVVDAEDGIRNDSASPLGRIELETCRHNYTDCASARFADTWFFGALIPQTHLFSGDLDKLGKAVRIAQKHQLSGHYSGSTDDGSAGAMLCDKLQALGYAGAVIATGKDRGWHTENKYTHITWDQARQIIASWIADGR